MFLKCLPVKIATVSALHKMDVLQLLNPIIVLSSLFGLTPVVQQICESSNIKEYRLSKFWLLYAAMFICVQIVLEITMIWSVHGELHEAVLITLFQALSRGSFIFVLIIKIVSMCHTRKLIHLLNKLTYLTVDKINSKHTYITNKTSVCFIVCNIIAIIGLSCSLLVKFSVSKSSNLIFIILCILRFMVSMLPYLQLMHILVVLKYKFEALNSTIEPLTLHPFASFSMTTNHLIQTKCHQANKPDNTGFVKRLSYLHHSFCDLLQDFNSIYSVQVTFVLGMVFILTTVCLYITARSGTGDHSTLAMHAGVLLFSLKILALIWLCNRIYFQVSSNFRTNDNWKFGSTIFNFITIFINWN